MGNLSEHFNNRDFACRCGQCRGQLRVHLGLVGALEAISDHFRRVPRVVDAFRCEFYAEKHDTPKKNAHRMGKAAHIQVEGAGLKDVYLFAKSLPEICGLGFYPSENCIHIDTRETKNPGEKDEWVKEGGKIAVLTSDLRSKYGL